MSYNEWSFYIFVLAECKVVLKCSLTGGHLVASVADVLDEESQLFLKQKL